MVKSVNMDREKILLDEARINYRIFSDIINSYEKKFNNIFLMSTATLSIFLLVLTSIFNFGKDTFFKLNTENAPIGFIIVSVLLGFFSGVIFFCLTSAMRKCASALKRKKGDFEYFEYTIKAKVESIEHETKKLMQDLLKHYNEMLGKSTTAVEDLRNEYEDAGRQLNIGVSFIIIGFTVIIFTTAILNNLNLFN